MIKQQPSYLWEDDSDTVVGRAQTLNELVISNGYIR